MMNYQLPNWNTVGGTLNLAKTLWGLSGSCSSLTLMTWMTLMTWRSGFETLRGIPMHDFFLFGIILYDPNVTNMSSQCHSTRNVSDNLWISVGLNFLDDFLPSGPIFWHIWQDRKLQRPRAWSLVPHRPRGESSQHMFKKPKGFSTKSTHLKRNLPVMFQVSMPFCLGLFGLVWFVYWFVWFVLGDFQKSIRNSYLCRNATSESGPQKIK